MCEIKRICGRIADRWATGRLICDCAVALRLQRTEFPLRTKSPRRGVRVDEIQAKHLAKVEELTLYVVAQQKQLDHQARLIAELQAPK